MARQDEFVECLLAKRFDKEVEAISVVFLVISHCWHGCAMPVTQLCHAIGTAVPCRWHNGCVGTYQDNRMLFADMERSNDETALPVQFLDVIEKTCRTGGLHGETG